MFASCQNVTTDIYLTSQESLNCNTATLLVMSMELIPLPSQHESPVALLLHKITN